VWVPESCKNMPFLRVGRAEWDVESVFGFGGVIYDPEAVNYLRHEVHYVIHIGLSTMSKHFRGIYRVRGYDLN
jgi:hypothetical protein